MPPINVGQQNGGEQLEADARDGSIMLDAC